jgi:hypothetical protein
MEVKRGDRGEEVKRIQQALKDAGFDIVVDGIFGERTEDAVRRFQEINGLDVDGIVGNQTGAALGILGIAEAAVDPDAVKQEAVRLAKQELARWSGKVETDPEMTPVLQDYYQTGVGESASAEDLQNKSWQASHPWSARFISWLMRRAGAGESFAYSRAHKTYIAAAKRNRERGDTNNPFWAFRVSEIAPEVGDLVCTARSGSGATYNNIESPPFRATHCDIVVDVDPNRLTVIGGNVGHRVGQKFVTTNTDGLIDQSGDQSGYFAVVRMQSP